jgi:hypothetical protein
MYVQCMPCTVYIVHNTLYTYKFNIIIDKIVLFKNMTFCLEIIIFDREVSFIVEVALNEE